MRPLPSVTAELANRSRSIQDDFQQIASILAMNPWPNPQFPMLTEDFADDGTRVYTYSDDYFPYAIHYVLFEPDEQNYGVISVIALTPLTRRRRPRGS